LLIKKNNGVADQKNTFADQNNNSADHFTNSQKKIASPIPEIYISFWFRTINL
jgi:hypothetical protein